MSPAPYVRKFKTSSAKGGDLGGPVHRERVVKRLKQQIMKNQKKTRNQTSEE
jgi:hypothetical protein